MTLSPDRRHIAHSFAPHPGGLTVDDTLLVPRIRRRLPDRRAHTPGRISESDRSAEEDSLQRSTALGSTWLNDSTVILLTVEPTGRGRISAQGLCWLVKVGGLSIGNLNRVMRMVEEARFAKGLFVSDKPLEIRTWGPVRLSRCLVTDIGPWDRLQRQAHVARRGPESR